MANAPIIPSQGERVIIVGQTGSGKTAFAIWLLQRIEFAPCVIYDVKIEPKFDNLKPNIVVSDMKGVIDNLGNEEVDYIIVRPPVELLGDPEALDEMLWLHYLHGHGCPAFIDELVPFQRNGRAGKGLLALMQRGRSKGILTIMCAQRPVRVDRSCITEAQKGYIFYLSDRQDKKRINDLIPNFDEYPKPPKHGFYFFESGDDTPQLMAPIKLDSKMDTGYTDVALPDTGINDATDEQPVKETRNKHVWI